MRTPDWPTSCSVSARRSPSRPACRSCSPGSRDRRRRIRWTRRATRSLRAASRVSALLAAALVPDLSVSIVNTNSRDLLLACLESLRHEDAEIVVLDNASEDGSAEAVGERFPDVRVIAQDFRAGFGANHNTVIRATSGRYVYVLNEDTTSDDWGFARMVAHLGASPRVAVLGPKLVYPDGRHQDSAWRFPTPAVAALGLLTLGRAGGKQAPGSGPRGVDWLTGAALLLRRDALDQVGPFDEGFFLYS